MSMRNGNIAIDNTRFIFGTNFSGNPENDRFGDSRRKANIVIPDPEQAKDLIKQGFRVRETRPREDDDPSEFMPEYFVQAVLKYRDRFDKPVKYPPRVYLVSDGGDPVLLDEDSVEQIDNVRVKNVNVVLTPYQYDPVNNGMSLYIRTMYVEQDLDDDPYAQRYRRRRDDGEELPF